MLLVDLERLQVFDLKTSTVADSLTHFIIVNVNSGGFFFQLRMLLFHDDYLLSPFFQLLFQRVYLFLELLLKVDLDIVGF